MEDRTHLNIALILIQYKSQILSCQHEWMDVKTHNMKPTSVLTHINIMVFPRVEETVLGMAHLQRVVAEEYLQQLPPRVLPPGLLEQEQGCL